MKLEIGGGTKLQKGWVNLDINHGEGRWRRFAENTPWPTNADTVDAIKASHVMEHIPAGQPRIDVMNEAHRVIKPGGFFEIRVPLMIGTWHAIADPTHVSFWVPESFGYFDGAQHYDADYGIKLWTRVSFEVVGGWEGRWVGVKR